MTPAERLAAQRDALDMHEWGNDDLTPITLHCLVAIGEVLVELNARQARQEAAMMGAPS
ncbi:hypothetical protein SEA_GUANICA15_2 [Mycobacterium phage Guanica15]|uniref:Uncharacterized protein n=1 Tax=Mycobacterium phage Yunkel11 TaxID=2599886 RepID=A0A5J6TBW8_9CAUD|nr:hypothetical protein I5H09_gp002 [Mycobacterium phage Yunkel11]QFG08391.1 hypothetical protein SEA_YUNKEL11_2 [Mycobacterium phage Yunkel11]QFG09195.1 hypothetical protein SEA_EFRA2_2 [Mycobacterium phage Efra2]QFG11615.1 hypothetical protein SEA_GUANICA15_2 [Mycobacterium phage Guanica15]